MAGSWTLDRTNRFRVHQLAVFGPFRVIPVFLVGTAVRADLSDCVRTLPPLASQSRTRVRLRDAQLPPISRVAGNAPHQPGTVVLAMGEHCMADDSACCQSG